VPYDVHFLLSEFQSSRDGNIQRLLFFLCMNAVPADHSLAILSVLDYFHRNSVNDCFHV
jgi:hypothetical protein